MLLLVPAAPAAAGIRPISPQQGDRVPEGTRPVFKLDVTGRHHGVFVRVCRSPKRNADGVICDGVDVGKARRKRGTRFQYRARYFDLPGFWLNDPGTYYWQGYRAHCAKGLGDCKAEGPVVRFRVG
jgi:hypothetical protein